MPLVLTLALLVPPIFAVGQLTKRRFEEAAPALLLGLLLLLYLLGLAGLLGLGAWLLYALCAASLGWLAWQWLAKKQLTPRVFTPGFVLFVVLAAALWWLCRGRYYADWDEYSHWGRALKGVWLEQVLPAVSTVKDEFKEYPPGVAPLQAALMWAMRTGFREDVAIWVQGLFSVGLLMYPLRRFEWRNAPAALGSGLLLFLAPAMLFWDYYTETTVDGLLGVLFAFVLLVQFLGEDRAFDRALQGMALAALPLVKASGLLLAALACVVILADRLRRPADGAASVETLRLKAVGSGTLSGVGYGRASPEKPRFGEGPVGLLLTLIFPLVCALAAAGSWQVYMLAYNVPRRWSANGFSLGALWQLVSEGQPAWRAQTVQAFAANIFTDQNYGWPGGFLPYAGLFAVFIAAWAGLRWLLRRNAGGRQQAARFGRAFWVMWAGGLVYTLLMLAGYLFIFSEYEAVRLASLSRYLNTWLCAMVVFLLGWLAMALPNAPWKRWAPALGGAALVWLLLGNPGQVLGAFATAPRQAVTLAAVRADYARAAEAIRATDQSRNPRVYIVAIDDLGETMLRMDYELAPQYLPDHFSSIGPDYAADDLMSLRLDAAGWAEMLAEGYDYVYIYRPSSAFVAEFGDLFDMVDNIRDGAMFRVEPQPDGGRVKLSLIGNW